MLLDTTSTAATNFAQMASRSVQFAQAASEDRPSIPSSLPLPASILFVHSLGVILVVACLAGVTRVLKISGRRTILAEGKRTPLPTTNLPNEPWTADEKRRDLAVTDKSYPARLASKTYDEVFPDLTKAADLASDVERRRMASDKELYWKLQNVEDHTDAIAEARSRLVELFDKTTAEAQHNSSNTILSLDRFERNSLQDFLLQSHQSATSRYERYLERRSAGGPREMFPSAEYAREWLRLAAVVKYVDGSWLGGILGVGTGRAACLGEASNAADGHLERQVARMAWQVISEEFGDGDLQKNHVYLYETLMNKMSPGAPDTNGSTSPGYVRSFDDLQADQGVPRCWEAAVGQQCIGLLASTRDFFPEALGFNMAYEALPYHLLVSARELRELRIDNYYFAIHVTIDNADSGHSAMARMAVERYLEGVLERDGPDAMASVWSRVQAGYILAEGLPTTPSGPIEFEPVRDSQGQFWQPRVAYPPVTADEAKLVDLIMRKAHAADKMHCTSRMLIGGETVEQWMNPATITKERTLAFIRGLAEKRPFVIPGEPPRSRLVRELEWGGKMFGAFSRLETEVVRAWICSLRPQLSCEGAYESFVGSSHLREHGKPTDLTPFQQRAVDLWGVYETLPVTQPQAFPKHNGIVESLIEAPLFAQQSPHIDFDRIRSIWYISTSLLECFPLQPCKYATPLGMVTLRILRSTLGFTALHRPEDICSGTDDMNSGADQDIVGLWELGEEMDRASGRTPPDDVVQIANQVTDIRADQFCADLLAIRRRPYANSARLLGISLALCNGLHASDTLRNLLPRQVDRTRLERIVREEKDALSDYLQLQCTGVDQSWRDQFSDGYLWAKSELTGILNLDGSV